MAKRNRQNNYPEVRPWIRVAVAEEDKRPATRLWKGEPTPERIKKEQGKHVRFLRKNGRTYPRADVLADRLEGCRLDQRCLSGACPQCAQLLQRWFVRRSKKFIANADCDQHRAARLSGGAGPAELILDGQFRAATEIYPGKG